MTPLSVPSDGPARPRNAPKAERTLKSQLSQHSVRQRESQMSSSHTSLDRHLCRRDQKPSRQLLFPEPKSGKKIRCGLYTAPHGFRSFHKIEIKSQIIKRVVLLKRHLFSFNKVKQLLTTVIIIDQNDDRLRERSMGKLDHCLSVISDKRCQLARSMTNSKHVMNGRGIVHKPNVAFELAVLERSKARMKSWKPSRRTSEVDGICFALGNNCGLP